MDEVAFLVGYYLGILTDPFLLFGAFLTHRFTKDWSWATRIASVSAIAFAFSIFSAWIYSLAEVGSHVPSLPMFTMSFTGFGLIVLLIGFVAHLFGVINSAKSAKQRGRHFEMFAVTRNFFITHYLISSLAFAWFGVVSLASGVSNESTYRSRTSIWQIEPALLATGAVLIALAFVVYQTGRKRSADSQG